jgi:multidrug transporter EmrE-like cation transporter
MNYILSMHYLIWILLSVVFFGFGEYSAKMFALGPRIAPVLSMVAFYICGSLVWLPAILQRNQLSIVGTIWNISALLVTIIIGCGFFHEHLTYTNIAGIALAFISIVLLTY